VAIRERWATLVNDAFRAAGLEQRVDHRSLRAQGIDREPVSHIPFAAYQMERRGLRSEVAERIRERYRARVAARAAQPASTLAVEAAGRAPDPFAQGVAGIEEIRQRAREAWLQLRREAQPGAEAQPAAEPHATRQKARDQSASAADLQSDAVDKDFCL